MAANAFYAVKYLQDRYRLAPHQAAGLVGTWQQESGDNLNTGARNRGDGRDGSDSIGIAQWNGDRAQGLHSFAKSRGADWTNLDTQLDYAMHELTKGSEKQWGDRLLAAGDVNAAARAAISFERPEGWSVDNPMGGHGWGNRFANAQRLLGASPEEIARAQASSTPMPSGEAPSASRGLLDLGGGSVLAMPQYANAFAGTQVASNDASFMPGNPAQAAITEALTPKTSNVDDEMRRLGFTAEGEAPAQPDMEFVPPTPAQPAQPLSVDQQMQQLGFTAETAPAPAAPIMANPATAAPPAPRQAPAAPEEPSFLDGVVRAVGRGTVGIGSYLDELNAATNATLAPLVDPMLPDSFEKLPGATWDERYDQALGIQRRKDQQFDEQHPYVSTGAQIAGGVASGGAALSAAPRAAGVVLGTGGRTMLGQAATAAGSGLGIGAVQGFGAGEGGFGNRAARAGVDGLVGAGAGAALAPVANVIGKGVDAAVNRFVVPQAAVGQGGQKLLRDTLADEGLTMEQATQMAQRMGPTAMLADATPGLRYRTEQLAQSDNPARSGVINNITRRSDEANARIRTAYDGAMGETPNIKTTLDDLTRTAKTNADALYGQARSENLPVNLRPVIDAIDGQLLTPAERIAGPSSLPMDEVDSALSWLRGQLTDGDNVRTGINHLDRLERRVRAKTKAAFESGKSDVGHALNEAGKVLRAQLVDSSPVYAQARAQFRDDSATMEAFDTGRKLFSNKVHPDFLEADLVDMSAAERDALRLGVRAAVDETMGRVRNGTLKGRQLLDSDFNERKVLMVLGEQDGRALIDSLGAEQAMADTAREVIQGSATARRTDNPFRPSNSKDTGVAGAIRSAGNLKFGDAAAATLDIAGKQNRGRASNKLARELGPVLTATGSERDAYLRQLNAAIKTRRSLDQREYDQLFKALTRGGILSGGGFLGPYNP